MSHTSPRRLLWVLVALATAALLIAPASAVTAGGSGGSGHSGGSGDSLPDLRGLEILLTNDDSIQNARPNPTDGLGLYAIRKTLCNAGADVVVIAPWQVQSGKATAVTNSGAVRLGTKDLTGTDFADDCADAPAAGALYGLCLGADPCGPDSASATPADTVKFATRGGLAATVGWDEPDLVVSGINSGANIGSSVNDSGTVGAAIAAVEDEIPAVAFNTYPTEDWSVFPPENYEATAAWGARFLSGLRKAGLLEQSTFAVNVNYPNIAEGQPARRAVWTSVADGAYAAHTYQQVDDQTFNIVVERCTTGPICEVTKRDADITWFLDRHHITVTPITWDRTYGERTDRQLLATYERYVERRAPRP
jgi:5'-nucleotidase